LFLGRPAIIKQRFSKKYRHATLDSKLTQLRFKQVSNAAGPKIETPTLWSLVQEQIFVGPLTLTMCN